MHGVGERYTKVAAASEGARRRTKRMVACGLQHNDLLSNIDVRQRIGRHLVQQDAHHNFHWRPAVVGTRRLVLVGPRVQLPAGCVTAQDRVFCVLVRRFHSDDFLCLWLCGSGGLGL